MLIVKFLTISDLGLGSYVFLGYPYGKKGYKFYDLGTYEIFLSRDVQFHEHVFPFKTHSSTDISSTPTSSMVNPSLHDDDSLVEKT